MALIVSFIKILSHSFKTLGLLTQTMMNGGQLSLVNENLISWDRNFRKGIENFLRRGENPTA